MMAAVLTIVLLAAPSEAVSRAHFVKAQKAFSQHDWRHALDEFTAAGEAAPAELPDLWFDIGQCHRNLGHARQAAAAFTRYLSLAPDAPDRDKVRALVAALGGKLPDDPAPVVVASAAPVAAAPPAPVVPVVPVSLDAPPAAATPGPAAEATTPAVAASALPLVPAADTPPPPRRHRRWKLWTGLAIGAAVVAVGVGLGVGLGTASNGTSPTQPLPALGSAATFDTRGH
ncbi:MAG TPA: tetratricopeptide repeat protein [Polyangia bacterium]